MITGLNIMFPAGGQVVVQMDSSAFMAPGYTKPVIYQRNQNGAWFKVERKGGNSINDRDYRYVEVGNQIIDDGQKILDFLTQAQYHANQMSKAKNTSYPYG